MAGKGFRRMRLDIRPSYNRDMRRIRQADVRRRLARRLEELEAAPRISEVRSTLKMAGYDNIYRIRVGAYRLVVEVEGDLVSLLRVAHRRDVYR